MKLTLINLKYVAYLFSTFSFISASLQDGYSKLRYGHRLDGKMINSFTEYSILECVEGCLRTTRCKSLSYYKGANYCEINYENRRTTPERYMEDERWIYSEREDWDKNITGACMNANCPDNQKCKPLPFGKFGCILSDCGLPDVEGADINSSDRWDGIGILRRIHIKCYKEFYQTGSGIMTCGSSGKWITDLRCEGNIFEDHIYLLQGAQLSWQEAKEKCGEFQAYLTEINSESENIWITQKLMNPFFGKTTKENTWISVAWIGANDRETEGRFIWSHSKTPLDKTYQNWYPGEPNNTGNEDCVLMAHFLNGTWNDFPCSQKRPFICEKELQ